MAAGMSDLAAQAAVEGVGAGYEELYGEQIHMVINEVTGGVEIVLYWPID